MPKNDQIWPKIGIFGQFGPGHAGLFGALLVGGLVVVARAVSRQDTYLLYNCGNRNGGDISLMSRWDSATGAEVVCRDFSILCKYILQH